MSSKACCEDLNEASAEEGRDGAAMERKERIAAQVERLACVRHRAEPWVAVREVGLGAADAGRAVGAQRGERLVDPRVEVTPHLSGEFRSRVLDVLPASHAGI